MALLNPALHRLLSPLRTLPLRHAWRRVVGAGPGFRRTLGMPGLVFLSAALLGAGFTPAAIAQAAGDVPADPGGQAAGGNAAPTVVDTGSDPSASATAAASDTAGNSYKIRLVTTPSPLAPGKNGLLAITIVKVAAGENADTADTTPLAGAVTIARIRPATAAPNSRWAIAHPVEGPPGTYSFHAIFRVKGIYQLSVTVVPVNGEPFTAVVAARVGLPKSSGDAGSAGPPSGGPGAPADAAGPPAPAGTNTGAAGESVAATDAGPGVHPVVAAGRTPDQSDGTAAGSAGAAASPADAGAGAVGPPESGLAGGVPPAPTEPAPFTCDPKDPGTVRNLGIPMISEVTTYDRMPPAARAEKIAARLNDCYVNDLKYPRTVTNLREGNLAGDSRRTEYVFFGYLHPNGRDTADILATVDGATAAHYGVSPVKLACWWRDILRDWLLIDQGQPPRFTVPYTPLLLDFYKQIAAAQGDARSRFIEATRSMIDSGDEYEKLRLLSGRVPAGYRVVPDGYHPILNDDSNPKTSG